MNTPHDAAGIRRMASSARGWPPLLYLLVVTAAMNSHSTIANANDASIRVLQPVRTLTGHQGRVKVLVFTRDGRLISGANILLEKGVEGEIKIWDVKRGVELPGWKEPVNSVVSLSLTPDEKTIAVGGIGQYDAERDTWNGELTLRETATGKITAKLGEHTAEVFAVCFSPDGKRLATGGWDQKVVLWDLATLRPLFTMTGIGASSHTLAFSPDGKLLASNSSQSCQLWNLSTGSGHARLECRDLGYGVPRLAFSPDGKTLAACCEKGIAVWDVASSRRTAVLKEGLVPPLQCLAYSPNGRMLAVGQWDGTITLFDANSGKRVALLKDHTKPVRALAFSPTESLLVSAGEDQVTNVWEVVGSK